MRWPKTIRSGSDDYEGLIVGLLVVVGRVIQPAKWTAIGLEEAILPWCLGLVDDPDLGLPGDGRFYRRQCAHA